jgi:hypothetical protein
MIRFLVRLAITVATLAGLAILAETWLRLRAGGEAPGPIRVRAVIRAPITRVWDELVDIEGQPRWMHDMKSVRMAGRPPYGVGSRGDATVRMYGISVNDPVRITEFVPPRRFAIAHEGLVAGGGRFDVEPGADPNNTIVRWEERLAMPLLPHLGAGLAAPVFRHVFELDLERFAKLVEGTS